LFQNSRIELQMANELIHRLYIAQDSWQLTSEERTMRNDLKTRVLGLTTIERSRRRQAARIIWLKRGDACTKLFHLKANKRKRKNFIAYLKNVNGGLSWHHEEKEHILHSFFRTSLDQENKGKPP
jgi:hypothetical protein